MGLIKRKYADFLENIQYHLVNGLWPLERLQFYFSLSFDFTPHNGDSGSTLREMWQKEAIYPVKSKLLLS
jgi:hypothetical protein